MSPHPSCSLALVAGAALAACSLHATAQDAWPCEIVLTQARIVMYQPQLESFETNTVTARAAVSVKRSGDAQPLFGAVWISARIGTDRDERMATFSDIVVTDIKFPNATDDERADLAAALGQGLEQHTIQIAQDRLLAMLETVAQPGAAAHGLRAPLPAIVFSTNPAVLVSIDGEPRLKAVPGAPLMRVVNTPFLILLDTASASYFLDAGGRWFAAKELLGPWHQALAVPDAVKSVGSNTLVAAADDAALPLQAVIIATNAAELLCIDGAPEFGVLRGTDLLYIQNTEADVFMDIKTQRVYVLCSGRWYGAPGVDGPWEHVAVANLPADFQRIGADSPKADVLAHVPGTQEARDAQLDAMIPQTAAVPRGETNLPVVFDGEPAFETTGATGVEYAVNSPYSVVRAEGRYYCCLDGVWYAANTMPVVVQNTGDGVLYAASPAAWRVCEVVPRVIYTIPPSCPVYPVTYCYVYDTTPEVVYVGYTPGYLGCYIYDGCIVYGTGYSYVPWYRSYYWPRPCTFGYGFRYSSYSGTWGIGFSFGSCIGSWFFFGWGSAFGPSYHAWNGFGWWGNARYHHNRSTISCVQNIYAYNKHGYDRRGVHEGHDRSALSTADRARVNRVEPVPAHSRTTKTSGDLRSKLSETQRPLSSSRTKSVTRDDTRSGLHPSSGEPNTLFADKNGNVYRRGLHGWEQHDGKTWTATEPGKTSGGSHAVTPTTRPAQPVLHTQERPVPQPVQPAQHATTQPAQPAKPAQPARPTAQPAPHAPQSSLDRDFSARAHGEARLQSSSGSTTIRSAPSTISSRPGMGSVSIRPGMSSPAPPLGSTASPNVQGGGR